MIVGGGPAGLCASIFLKESRSCDVTVFERDEPGETYGWGITLPQRTVTKLERTHRVLADELRRQSVAWDRIHVFHRGRRVEIAGTGLLGISRAGLLRALHQSCRDAGVQLRFDANVSPGAVPDCDMLICADGANSLMRASRIAEFGTSVRAGYNRYVWLGTPRLFEGLSLIIAQGDAGVFVAHAYPYSPTSSTFIVECGPETWANANMNTMSAHDTCEYLARLFREPLQGHPVVAREPLRWNTFAHVTNACWSHEHIVLTGDAAHAVHFSVGSGTMLAIEDAMTLASTLGRHAMLSSALMEFQAEREAVMESYRALEQVTVARLERMQSFIELEPLELAYQLLSR